MLKHMHLVNLSFPFLETPPKRVRRFLPWRINGVRLAGKGVGVTNHLHADTPSQAVQYGDDRIAIFNFEERVDGVAHPVPSVSPLQEENFKAMFAREIGKLDNWVAEAGWRLPSPFPRLRVFVSQHFRTARSLVPQWTGDPGRMEFPSFRVAVGEANILHELVHIYFPNANRMLAEGLAVYLQQEIGGNRAYPNFGEDLHLFVQCKLHTELGSELKDICIDCLDQITTPSLLALRVGRNIVKGSWPYLFAGSFVRFLVETYGIDRFRSLYTRTPLVPLQRDAGSPSRWTEVYGLSLTDLELQWKSLISRLDYRQVDSFE